jgi:hypothetical protein
VEARPTGGGDLSGILKMITPAASGIATGPTDAIGSIDPSVPIGWWESRFQAAWFHFRADGLRLARFLRELPQAEARPALLGESVTPLRSLAHDDARLVSGKVQNLRVAAARLDGLRVAGEAPFSFWRAVGRPTAARGYVEGRELREGCLIASVGGGLCQLSNALYSAALDAGMEILERHPHSRIVPGSLAEQGRDATVFWNYIDLRFRSRAPFAVRARLTCDRLVVQLWGSVPKPAAEREAGTEPRAPLPILLRNDRRPGDCASCRQDDCVHQIVPSPRAGRAAYLLDDAWPELDAWLGAEARAGDVALVPLDGAARRRLNYGWSALRSPGLETVEHRALTWRRSLASRRLAEQGAARQRKLLELDRAFARAYVREIPFDADRLAVPVSLLAEVWRLGACGGRELTVLMNRAPLAMLQRDLDRGAALHPESPTLADFRADARLAEAEDRALREARRFVTPHAAVADFLAGRYGAPVVHLPWVAGNPGLPSARGPGVLFPASALGRKGAYEVRAACRELGLGVQILGKATEGEGFWQGLNAAPADPAHPFEGIGRVVLPAFVEHRPRILLRAIAAGIPVICSPECGIASQTPGVTIVSSGDLPALVAGLRSSALPG